MYPLRLSKKSLVIWLVVSLMGVSFFSILRNSNVAVAATAPTLLDVRISTGADDAEQRTTNGKMYLDSSNLEFVNDPVTAKGDQTVGLRFNGINVPRGSTVTKAFLEFQVIEASSEATSLNLQGEAADNAAAFTTSQKNISKRSKTSASTSWDNLPAWSTVGAKVQTPDLSGIVQEIVNRSGWKAGNSLAFIVDGSGRRVASAFEASAANAALLHIEYIPPAAPTATATRLPATATATKLPATPTATATRLPTTATPTATPQAGYDQPPATATPVGPAPTTAPTTAPTAAPTTTPTAAPTTAPTATPTATSVPSTSGDYMIMSRSNLLALSYSGSAWDAMKIAADASAGAPDLCNQDNRTHPKVALAAALIYARGGNQAYADKAKNLILAAYPTQKDGCPNAVLSLGRQLGAYVIAADLIRLNDAGFNNWLSAVRTRNIGGHSRWYVLRDTAYDSANNWGTFALASVIAADRFLGDKAALDKDWQVFSAYGVPHGWPFTKTSSYNEQWSCVATDSTGKLPIAINTACTKSGYNLDGAPVEDSSRTAFPTVGNYPAESAQGYVVQAMILQQAGYPAWTVNTSQVRRVAEFRARFNNLNYSSADYYVTWMTNKMYGLNQPTQPAGFGRIFGFTDWLFAP